MNEDTFGVSKSGERKSIDELRCPNEIPRRSLEEHRSRKWATGDHVSDKVDNWRRKSDATETGNIATKKNVDGSVFAESSFGKSRASTESSNNSRKNSMSADGKKKTSVEATSKKPANTAAKTTATSTATKLESSAPPFVPPKLSPKSAPFVPQTMTMRKTDSAKEEEEEKTAADMKRSSSQTHLNGKPDPKGPSGLKKMFAKLFRSGKDAADDKEKGASSKASSSSSSVYDTM
jgi:hypothetical protein